MILEKKTSVLSGKYAVVVHYQEPLINKVALNVDPIHQKKSKKTRPIPGLHNIP